ncbi:MAG TPA: GAF domain-containing sensor histidine kinase [Candidatus Nitrosopolaris sp.]|nr:GAF domain-containing sensor histidine kinase [Candidatus Nitrosopolaris sp.]
MSRGQDRKDVLLEAGLTLASELSLPIVLQRIVDLAAQLTDARYGALGVIGEGGELEQFITTGISAKQRRAIGALPRGRGILGHLIREPRPIRITNISDHPKSVGFPAQHPAMHSFLGAPIKAMGKVFGNIYLAEKRSASAFSAADEESVVILATQAGVAIANATLYAETRQRERWLDALKNITGEILAGSDADSQLAGIAEHARDLAGADSATILTISPIPGQLIVAAAVGARAADVRGQSVPAAKSLSGDVMESGRPLVTEDASAHRGAYQPVLRLGRVGPAIFVPLRVRGRATGTLMVANVKGGRLFDPGTVRLVETFADQASVAMEYAGAQAHVRRIGLLEERERIARELHDGVIQALFAVGMGLQGTALMSGSTQQAERIEGAVGELDKVILDLRNYIFGLRPGILADRQLDQALRALGEEVQASSGFKVTVEVDSDLAASLSGRSHEIVQVTREALSNVAKHAKATTAAVRLGPAGRSALLTIEDDGSGFDARGESAGNGLRNMRERAASMGGSLRIVSKRGQGTSLRIAFPVSQDRAIRPPRKGTTGNAPSRAAVGR